MYRRPKFLEVLLDIRQEMARQADYDVDLFAEMIRSGKFTADETKIHSMELETSETKKKAKAKRKA
ncbi:MAG TPA: hypothetical protein PKY59_11920 [Pyrinomonadaceae bacterium]|nr:hypothetical protein [Pyrinomonadaceae bacterium]